MKKSIKLALALLCSFAFLALLTACFAPLLPDESAAHIHSYSKDYTYDGEMHYLTCSCGEKFGEAHVYSETVEIEKPASCSATGIGKAVCTKCGQAKEVTVSMEDHLFGKWTVVTPATETEAGSESHECTLCHQTETRSIPAGSTLLRVESKDYYGCKFLLSLGKSGQTALYAYEKICAGAAGMQEEISLTGDGYDVKETDLTLAFNCYRADYPQHFWVEDGYGYVYSETAVTKIRPHYSVADAKDLPAMKNAFDTAVAALLSDVKGSMSEVEREFAIHDKLVTNVQYDTTLAKEHIHDAYGAIVGKSAVCDGYVKAFQYLLYSAGIQNTLIYGDVQIGTQSASHTWNAVLLDGDYYLVDITWDDPTDNGPDDISRNYLNLTSADFALNHTPASAFEEGNRARYDVPTATATAYHYYTYFGYAKDSFTVSNMASAIAVALENGVTKEYPLYVTGGTTKAEVDSYLADQNNVNALWEEIMTLLKMDKPNVSYSVDSNGHLIVLTVTQGTLTLADHHFGEFAVTRPASCTLVGISERTCKYCGAVDQAEIPMKNHAYGAWAVTTAATATTTGEKERTCTVCTHKDVAVIPMLIELSPLTREDYYGYQYLSARTDGAKLLYFYNLIADTVENDLLPETIALDGNIEYSLTTDELGVVYKCYRADYPQHFWLEDGYAYTKDGVVAVTVSPKYTVTSTSALNAMKTAVEAKIALLLDGIDGNMTDVEMEIELHNRLILHNAYDTTLALPHVHDIYGSLVNATSVCDGYAEAFQILMYECGIPCTVLAGEANNGSGTENHAWNAVSLGGKWYLVDVTWDDPIGNAADNIEYTYLNITAAQMGENHTVDPAQTVFTVPVCTSTDAQYYYYFGYTADSFTVDSFRTVLSKEIADGVTEDYSVYIIAGDMTMQKVANAFDDTAFNTAFFNACKELLHLTSVSLLYSVDPSGHVLTFTITEKTAD